MTIFLNQISINLILRNTRLNKNLSSIVFKYVDYSLKNLSNMVDNKKLKPIIELNFVDLIVKAIRYGYVGFYMNYHCQTEITNWKKNIV